MRMEGNDSWTSTMRMMPASSRPPLHPASTPITAPNARRDERRAERNEERGLRALENLPEDVAADLVRAEQGDRAVRQDGERRQQARARVHADRRELHVPECRDANKQSDRHCDQRRPGDKPVTAESRDRRTPDRAAAHVRNLGSM